MAVVNLAVVLARLMLVAGDAELVALVLELRRVRIVAIGATDVLRIHLAFEERGELIDLVEDLPVGMIGRRRKRLVRKVVVIVAARGVAGSNDAAANGREHRPAPEVDYC